MSSNTGVVIINYNTYAETIECVESLVRYSTESNIYIYVIDNASKDDSGIRLKEYFTHHNRISVILSDVNLGFSGGNNIGIRAAIENGCEYIYLLNSDIVLMNDIVTPINNLLNKGYAVVGPSVFNIHHEYTQYAKKGLTLQSYILDKKLLRSFFKKKTFDLRHFAYDEKTDFIFPGMVSGCCFAFTKSFIQSIGLLDDHVFLYYEEDILAHIIKDKKLSTAICASAKVIHKEGVATKRVASDKMLLTRYYRWLSSLYVLKEYARCNILTCAFISISNMFVWMIFSLLKKGYRNRLSDFAKDNLRILTGNN